MTRSVSPPVVFSPAPSLDLASVYDAHADFVWRSLQRLGVESRDASDLLQEVFVVVHRRIGEYDAERPLRPWLFGICAGLARNYRRGRMRAREDLHAAPPEAVEPRSPEDDLESQRRRERGARLLAALDPEKRAVFVMFEVEGMSGREIAEALGIARGTVHSRIHAARRDLSAALGVSTGEGATDDE